MKMRAVERAMLAAAVGVSLACSASAEDVELSFGVTGVLQGSSGADSLSSEGDVADASTSIDAEITARVGEKGLVYAHFEAGLGEGIDGEVPALSGFNDDADDDASARLTELWYEHRWRQEGPRLRIGTVDLSTDFDANAVANSETDQFLSGGFVNSAVIEFPSHNCFGMMLWTSAGERLDIGVGLAEADADWEDVFDKPFAILELDFKLDPGGRRGHCRLYGWWNGLDHVHLTDAARTEEKGYGLGISLDQVVSEAVTVFARYGWERGSIYQVESAWSAGFELSGKAYGRDRGQLGLAYGVAVIGEPWKSTSSVNDGDEHHFEFYYRFAPSDKLSVSPDVQWVRNPGGDADSDDVWVFGVRTQLSF